MKEQSKTEYLDERDFLTLLLFVREAGIDEEVEVEVYGYLDVESRDMEGLYVLNRKGQDITKILTKRALNKLNERLYQHVCDKLRDEWQQAEDDRVNYLIDEARERRRNS